MCVCVIVVVVEVVDSFGNSLFFLNLDDQIKMSFPCSRLSYFFFCLEGVKLIDLNSLNRFLVLGFDFLHKIIDVYSINVFTQFKHSIQFASFVAVHIVQ